MGVTGSSGGSKQQPPALYDCRETSGCTSVTFLFPRRQSTVSVPSVTSISDIVMCMLFACVNQKAANDEFALVVASIRDEYFRRPAGQVCFWGDEKLIIGGMDLESGREGGTWMAMNRSGQIGALLNVLQPVRTVVHGLRNRGFLVPEFLKSRNSGSDFLKSLSVRSRDYADFLMVTLDFALESRTTSLSYYTSLERDALPVVLTPSGVQSFAFGNNHPHKPWIKTMVAQKVFDGITQRNKKVSHKKKLVAELMHMMNDETTYFPDEQLLKDGEGYEKSFLQSLSSIKVRIPFVGFGSRTQSVVTVTPNGRVTFVERTIHSLDQDWDPDSNTQPVRTFPFPDQ